jgi:hypothetical protein
MGTTGTLGAVAGGQTEQTGQPPRAWHYALCYTLYAALLVLCYYAFWTWRATIEVLAAYYYRTEHTREAFQATYLVIILLAGIVLFVLAVVGESYMRGSFGSGGIRGWALHPVRRVLVRFAQLATPLVVSLIVALALQEWTLWRAALSGS